LGKSVSSTADHTGYTGYTPTSKRIVLPKLSQHRCLREVFGHTMRGDMAYEVPMIERSPPGLGFWGGGRGESRRHMTSATMVRS
jgi:hypothetical protein